MRGRGSYRQTYGETNGSIRVKQEIKVEDIDSEMIDISDDKDVIEVKTQKSKHISKPKNKLTIDVITIESDEEVDGDIQMLDSGYDSSTTISDKPLYCLTPFNNKKTKKWNKSVEQILTEEEECDYNELTSADFYKTPRIHPSVISIELKDKNRFNCFNESISRNKHLFEDKTVLVIGSGTGLLALFAARANARHIIIVDRPGIHKIISTVIERNRPKLPKRTTFSIMKSVEESVLPIDVKTVDIIVSDWTNHSLFFKSLIKSVIIARDKWLKKGGLIFPDSAHFYIAGAHDFVHKHRAKDKRKSDSFFVKRIDYWDKNVYNCDMTAIRKEVLSEPLHENIIKSQVITNECLLKAFNLYELTLRDINFCNPFELMATKDHYLQTFVLFFDIIFSKSQTVPIMYSTRPTAPKHMFRPTIFFIDSEKQLVLHKNNKINGHFKYCLSEDLTKMSVSIKYKLKNRYFDVDEELNFKTN